MFRADCMVSLYSYADLIYPFIECSFVCIDKNMVKFRPEVHCPHIGPSGGDMCGMWSFYLDGTSYTTIHVPQLHAITSMLSKAFRSHRHWWRQTQVTPQLIWVGCRPTPLTSCLKQARRWLYQPLLHLWVSLKLAEWNNLIDVLASTRFQRCCCLLFCT